MDFYTDFLTAHKLPEAYITAAQKHFDPIAEAILVQQQQKGQPLMVALNGSQGSGKSTLADYLKHWFEAQGKSVLSVSLDDFYLTKGERKALATSVHPLFETRGVPGTHDTGLMKQVFESLLTGQLPVAVPRFNKAVDDRVADNEWTLVKQSVDIIIVEGWFWGALHQTPDALSQPVNSLEAQEDINGQWRHYVNQQLAEYYEPLYSNMDCWLMLKAPSFECVYLWRLEQEEKLKERLAAQSNADTSGVMSPEAVQRFIQFYQRITENLLESLPDQADVVWQLDSDRSIETMIIRNKFSHLEGVSE